jgi:hypothetical protein
MLVNLVIFKNTTEAKAVETEAKAYGLSSLDPNHALDIGRVASKAKKWASHAIVNNGSEVASFLGLQGDEDAHYEWNTSMKRWYFYNGEGKMVGWATPITDKEGEHKKRERYAKESKACLEVMKKYGMA